MLVGGTALLARLLETTMMMTKTPIEAKMMIAKSFVRILSVLMREVYVERSWSSLVRRVSVTL
jgi:hypothetical protein